jgi:hypothetical protein
MKLIHFLSVTILGGFEDCLKLEHIKLYAVGRFVLDCVDIVLFSYLRVSYVFPYFCFKFTYLRLLTMTSSR